MAERIKSRIQMKYGTANEWAEATEKGDFVPLEGEIIIYTDGEGSQTVPMLKVGDGTTTVSNLPFLASSPVSLTETEIRNICKIENSSN